MTRCNGRDPAYPGLACYLDKGHADTPCEFTDAVGEEWRRRALAAEAQATRLRDENTVLEVIGLMHLGKATLADKERLVDAAGRLD